MKNLARLALCALACLIFGSVSVKAQNITTVAGAGPVGLTANAASVGSPVAVRFDTAGNMFVLDNKYSRVLKVNAAGQMSVYAGNGTTGFSGDGLIATSGQMNGPSGMCIQPVTNNLFIADSDNNVIREVTASDGFMHTFAGIQTTNPSFGGDGAAATGAHFHFPDGCAFDSKGNLYIADRGNNEIRVVVATAGTPFTGTVVGSIYNFAGAGGAGPASPAFGYSADGTAAQGALIFGPFDVAVDASDNVFFADLGSNFNPDGTPGTTPANNNVIRVVLAADSTVHTVAGKVGVYGADNNVLATTAAINQPKGLSFDPTGNLYFCDTANHVIRKVSPSINGTISVVAGTIGHSGFLGDNGPATSANLSFPAGTTIDGLGNLFIADEDSNALRVVPSATYTAFHSNVAPGNIATLAGNGHASYGGNGSLSINGELNTPAGLAVDPSSNLIIAESNNDVIREIAAGTALLSTIAGQPENNGFLNGAAGVNALNGALSVATDASGAVYFADTANCLVRKIGASGTTTVAGTEPTPINPDNPIANHPICGFTTAGGPAVGTHLGLIQSVALDSKGNVFFSDSTNNVIWEVPKANSGTLKANNAYIVAGTQSTTGAFGGDGGAAAQSQLNSPIGIFIDIYDNLFIADAGNSRIREVPAVNIAAMNAGSIYTIAGTGTAGISGDGSAAISAKIQYPFAIVVDHAENVFFSDTTLNLAPAAPHTASTQTIREISGTTGNISTVAGITSTPGFSGDSGAATSAHLNFPMGLALIPGGPNTANLLIGDSINNRIRSVAGIANVAPVALASLSPNPVTFTAVAGTASPASVVTLTNGGGAVLMVTGPPSITGTNASDFMETDNCTTPGTVAAGGTCTINVIFSPPAGTTGARTATLTVTDNAFGGSQSVTLNGTIGTPVLTLTITDTDPSSTQTVTAGATATYNLSVAGNLPVTATITCTGAPTDATCTPAPASVAITPTAAGTFKVTVTTTVRGEMLPFNQPSTKMQPPSFLQIAPMASLALLFVVAMMLGWIQNQPSRMRLARVALSLCLILMPIAAATVLVGCGGGSSTTPPPPPPPATGTPAGTYTITVTATSGSTSANTKLTLVVN